MDINIDKQAIESLYEGRFVLQGGITTAEEFSEGFKAIASEPSDPNVVYAEISPVSWEEFSSKRNELIAEKEALAYQDLRAAEYPPMADYLDAVVKGDDAGVQAYIDACLAVKAKYPKPAE
jgi:Fe-S cluster biosynthesis and repair protein YggX